MAFRSLIFLFLTLPLFAATEKLDLRSLVRRAFQQSSSFQVVKSDKLEVDAPYWQEKVTWDPRVSLGVSRIEDRRKPLYPDSPTSLYSTLFSSSLSTLLPTGTAVQLELANSINDFEFANSPSGRLSETKLTVGLTQNLWRNSFGSATRYKEEAGALRSDAKNVQFEKATQDWVFNLIESYYAAWTAQARLRMTIQEVERKERFLKVTLIRAQRGTSQKPDVIQAESALRRAKLKQTDWVYQSREKWRALQVISGSPDSEPVDLELDPLSDKILEACATPKTEKDASENRLLRQYAKEAEAGELYAKATSNLLSPDLDLKVNFFSNGIDERAVKGLQENFRFSNPGFSVGLGLSIPIFNYDKKAEAAKASAEAMRSHAKWEIARKTWVKEYKDLCERLKRAENSREEFLDLKKAQSQRVLLEEQRFRLARSTVTNIIQAGDDAAEAQSDLDSIEVERRLIAWNLLRIEGTLTKNLNLESR